MRSSERGSISRITPRIFGLPQQDLIKCNRFTVIRESTPGLRIRLNTLRDTHTSSWRLIKTTLKNIKISNYYKKVHNLHERGLKIDDEGVSFPNARIHQEFYLVKWAWWVLSKWSINDVEKWEINVLGWLVVMKIQHL